MTGMWVIENGEYSDREPVGVAGSLDAAVAWVKATARGAGAWSGPDAFDDKMYSLRLASTDGGYPEVWTFVRVPVIEA